MPLSSPQEVRDLAARRFGILLQGDKDEWHSACPFQCPPDSGGSDRFIIFKEGNYWCRNCGASGWLKEKERGWRPSSADLELIAKRHKAQQQSDAEKLAAWQRAHAHAPWKDWMEQMPIEKWAEWETMGMPESVITQYSLGWREEVEIMTEKYGRLTLPAFTIPIAAPMNCEIVNIQYRLENVPAGVGKYRQAYNIPAAALYANQNQQGIVWVVEGAKKALVLNRLFDAKHQVVGLPSNVPSPALLEKIASYPFETIYLAFDPNSDNAIRRAVKYLTNRVRVLRLPDKPDDLVLAHGWDAARFLRYAKFARKEGNA